MTRDSSRADDTSPYCNNCGYSLVGLTKSSQCPECGLPIVEVLVRDTFPGMRGYRYESPRRALGMPLISIAQGPYGQEKSGRPIGFIAIGDHPRGIIAIGGNALGVVAIGGFARGVCCFGGFALGLFTFGGFSAGLIAAAGGFAAGTWAFGGFVVYLVGGLGGLAIPLWP